MSDGKDLPLAFYPELALHVAQGLTAAVFANKRTSPQVS